MRPATVAEACRRVRAGEPFDRAMGDFLQGFYAETSVASRGAMLAEEPAPFDDPRYDALVGGVAEYLFKRWAPECPPPWIADRRRYLSRPFFPNVGDDPGLREYLTFASPGEFKSRNVMVDDEPLRRANTPRR
jgi:hypothetical protein